MINKYLIIRELLNERHISQQALGDAIVVLQDTISLWEKTKSLPPCEMIIALAELYEVPSDYLLSRLTSEKVMDKDEIIARIRYFRNKAKLSQKALSKKINMNMGYINRLESKKDFLPSVVVLSKIITACGITVEEFFYNNPQNYSQDIEILEKLKNLSPDKRQALFDLIK